MMMFQLQSIQQSTLYLLVLLVITQIVTTTSTETTIVTASTSTNQKSKATTKTPNTLELINREIAKLPIHQDDTTSNSLDVVTYNKDHRDLQTTSSAICTSIQSIVFQNLVSCDCDIAPFDGLLDVACSQSNICSPSNILCGTLGFDVKFALFDAGNLTTNLCVSDIKLNALSQTFGPFCINYNIQVLKTNLRDLCPNGIISCLLGNFGGGGGSGGSGGGSTGGSTGGGGTTGGGGGGGVGMAAMGTDGGMTMDGGMGGGMGRRHRTLLMGAKSISDSTSSSIDATTAAATTAAATTTKARRVQKTATTTTATTTTKKVTTSFVSGCNVNVGGTVCNYCAPCDNKGGIKFDCSNAVPGLIQMDTCAKFKAWTGIGNTLKPRLPDLDLPPIVVISLSSVPSSAPSVAPSTF